jgi:hypothetical protein
LGYNAHEIIRDLKSLARDATGRLGGKPAVALCAPKQSGRPRRRFEFGLLVVVLGVGCLLQLGIVSGDRFGGSYDDAIYVTAAKSLATGEGYRIISLPQPVAQTLIPPFYPFVLSIIWRFYPQFPDNLVWMMLFSVVAMMGFLLLSYRYLVKNEYATSWQALAVVTLTAINWRMVSLATSTISEVLFALLSVAALHLAEKYEKERDTRRTGAVLGLIAGLAFLTRTSGLALLAALTMYYLYRRQWKKLLVPVLVSGLFVVGWFGWCYLNSKKGGGEHAAYYAGYARGISETVGRLQTLNGESWVKVYLNIVETNAMGLILVWAPLQSLGLRATMATPLLIPLILLSFAFLVAGFLREIRKGIRLLEIYCLFHLGLHLIVPSHSYERYLMPIVPFLLFFLVRELSILFQTIRAALISNQPILIKAAGAVVGFVVIAAAFVTLYSNSSGIYHTLIDTKPRVGSEQDKRTFGWITANTEPTSVLICFSDLKYFLYTGRTAVRSVPVSILALTVYQAKDPDPNELVTIFLNIVDENQGSYFILTPSDFRDQSPAYGASVEAYIAKHPEQFVPVFQSEDARNQIYQIKRGEDSNRVNKSRARTVVSGQPGLLCNNSSYLDIPL